MPTAQQYANDARDALGAAQRLLEQKGAGPEYKAAFDDYVAKKAAHDAAKSVEAEMKAMGASEKDTPKSSDLRNVTDADWIPGASKKELEDDKPDGIELKSEKGGTLWMPYARPDREGWIKGFPVSVQHPSVLKRLPPDLLRKKAMEEEAFATYVRKGVAWIAQNKSHLLPHLKDLQEATDSEGGYLVPSDQRSDIIFDPSNPSGVTRGIASTFTTTRDGGTWPFLSTDTSFAAIAEEATGSESDPAFNQLSFTIRKVGRNVDISEELLMDNGSNLVAFLGGLYTRAKGRYEDEQSVGGDGTTEPLGLRTTGATQGNVSDVTSLWTLAAPTAAQVIAGFYELPAQFRASSSWHVSSGIWGNLIAIGAAAAGIHLAEMIQNAVEPRLLGRPVVFWDGTGWDHTDGALPIAANEEVGAIGDFRYYYFIDRVGMTIRRSDDVAFRTDQVVFKARVRYDSFFAENNAFRILKAAAS